MKNNSVLGVGVAGTLLAAICCFTPMLVVLLGAIGLSGWLVWLDYVLIPTLIVFSVITVSAVGIMVKGSHDEERQ